jgi:hypothetical protein
MSALEQLNRTILLCRDYVADGLSDQYVCQSFQTLRVLCVADELNLSSHSGQTCLTTLVGLLSRMGMQVTLAIPEIPMVLQQPPLVGKSLRKSLLASSNKLITGAAVRQDSADHNPDLIFALGDSALENRLSPTWRLSGGDWHGAVAVEGTIPARAWTTHWPVGAMASAALAAGEAFKYVMRRMPLRSNEDRVFFEPSQACNWDFGSVPIPEGILNLGPVDIVSAGAISQAALYALLRLPNLQMTGRIFDDDSTAPSNVNRNMLTVVSDVGSDKVLVVAERCSSNFILTPIPRRFVSGISEAHRMAPHVLVGVDDIPSRWDVQRCTSGTLIVSGTSHFSISSSCHRQGDPCCGCQHPVDDLSGPNTIPTVSFISFWAGLAMAVRLIRHTLGMPYAMNRQHLWMTPLRLDQPHAALWTWVAPRVDCPVRCERSRRITDTSAVSTVNLLMARGTGQSHTL